MRFGRSRPCCNGTSCVRCASMSGGEACACCICVWMEARREGGEGGGKRRLACVQEGHMLHVTCTFCSRKRTKHVHMTAGRAFVQNWYQAVPRPLGFPHDPSHLACGFMGWWSRCLGPMSKPCMCCVLCVHHPASDCTTATCSSRELELTTVCLGHIRVNGTCCAATLKPSSILSTSSRGKLGQAQTLACSILWRQLVQFNPSIPLSSLSIHLTIRLPSHYHPPTFSFRPPNPPLLSSCRTRAAPRRATTLASCYYWRAAPSPTTVLLRCTC